jgi:hypothetical protein
MGVIEGARVGDVMYRNTEERTFGRSAEYEKNP